jgi:NAD(P)-dependent dehydrogenase (short-subunit alcohol dehydrogenase family)
MELQGATVMILGGSGLVGHAVARRLLERRPKAIVVVALTEREIEQATQALGPVAGGTQILTEYGNVYLPASLARADRATLTDSAENRRILIEDAYGDLTDEVIGRSFLVQLLERYRPAAVVDCINTATAFAYRDVYHSARGLHALAVKGEVDLAAVEKHLLTEPMPQLTRHIQIMVEGMRRAGTRAYVKIGTSGTGGMGFNIPYTHSEERPSRTLLTKSAVAGAHTLLLYLLGRTPDAPATVEIKPTAAIAWREIGCGPVHRAGSPIPLYDCPKPLPLGKAFGGGADGWVALGRPLESVYIDVGENGWFSREEFATITALGQMEFITPEEIADHVLMELEGRPTGRDVIAALDASTAGPTYRAGILREAAMRRLSELASQRGNASVAFEMLGPPRLSKLLFEAHLWSRLHASVAQLATADAEKLGRDAQALVERDAQLRAEILSVGIPIVCHDGASLYRGATVVVPPAEGEALAAAPRGWVDLRPTNCALWIERARSIVSQAAGRRAGSVASGSDEDWWAVDPGEPIAPWRMATWIFRHEDKGERIKR